MERRIPKSVWVDGVDHYYPSSASKQVKLESYEHACDANFSRRLVILANHVLDVNHLMLDYGKSHVPALILRISAIS
jgi:hypothetical protein